MSVFMWILGMAMTAGAQERPPAQLEYRAPAACPDREALAAGVAARIGEVAFGAEGARRVEVRVIEDAGEGWVATLAVDSGGLRAFRGQRCAEVVEAVATAVAVVLDDEPEAGTGTGRGTGGGTGAATVVVADAARATDTDTATDTATDTDTDTVRVTVEGSAGGLSLHRAMRYHEQSVAMATLGPQFERVCTAPCEAQLPRGVYHLGVSEETDAPLSYERLVRIDGPTALRIHVESRSTMRTTGVVMMIGGFVAALASSLWLGDRIHESDTLGAVVATTAAVGMLSVYTVGIVWALTGDEARVQARPL